MYLERTWKCKSCASSKRPSTPPWREASGKAADNGTSGEVRHSPLLKTADLDMRLLFCPSVASGT